jgi:hypothetical protein
MVDVTKPPRRRPPKLVCGWCDKRFAPQITGRPPSFCSASCRQRAYEKRKWSPYSTSDDLALHLLPPAAQRRVIEEVRRAHMSELIVSGVVPLQDTAQIDGVLDAVKPRNRPSLLRRIEAGCRQRADDKALAIMAHWRLAKQQPSRVPRAGAPR